MSTCFCAGNPCSVPVCTDAGGTSSLSDTILSDTAGVVYRGYAPIYAWLTGKSMDRVDPWTASLIKQDNTDGLIKAGMDPADAAAQAARDYCSSKTMAKPCDVSAWSLTTWLLVIGAAAIVLIVGTNAFVQKEL